MDILIEDLLLLLSEPKVIEFFWNRRIIQVFLDNLEEDLFCNLVKGYFLL